MSNDKGNPWGNDYSFRYNAMIHITHSFLQANRHKFINQHRLSKNKSIGDFINDNRMVIDDVIEMVGDSFDYQVSDLQMSIAVSMLAGSFVKEKNDGDNIYMFEVPNNTKASDIKKIVKSLNKSIPKGYKIIITCSGSIKKDWVGDIWLSQY